MRTCAKTGFSSLFLAPGLLRRGFASLAGITMVHSLRPLVLCGPSGCGKSTLLRLLFDEFPDKFGFSVSHTTRSPRPGEVDGKHYHFTTRDEMTAAIERGEFIESAVFSNNMYGTSKAAVAAVQALGKICVLDIEVEGVKQVKQTDLNPIYIFIKPPSMEELEKRLRDRNTETEESLQKRLTTARSELAYADIPGNFDLVFVNDNLEKAYARFRDFILGEEKKGSPSSADFWCCLGTTTTDRTSDDYYYMSANVTNANISSGGLDDYQPSIDQPSCQVESSAGISFDAGCDSGSGLGLGSVDSRGIC
ncbi:hypothetical protein FOCC_FOCC015380, partial [Frankliniella occidentalis]